MSRKVTRLAVLACMGAIALLVFSSISSDSPVAVEHAPTIKEVMRSPKILAAHPDGELVSVSSHSAKAAASTAKKIIPSTAALATSRPASTKPAGDQDIVIGVLTDPDSLRTVGMAVYTTWAREAESFAKVLFFIGSCSSEVEGFPGKLVCLDTPDIYPPQRKVFLMWKYYHDNLLANHKLFMKVDHDSYVNAPMLLNLARILLADPKFAKGETYVGLPATGRVEERKALGLDGKSYCSGLGYILNRESVSKIGPHLMTCLAGAVSNHSDTEMGRCIFSHTKTQCRALPKYVFRQVYYQQENGMVYPMKLIRGGQMSLKFLRMPKATHFDSVILHPLKRAEDFYRFHKQTMSRLRPSQPQISQESNAVSYRQAVKDLESTCVNSATRQRELFKFALPECPPPEKQVEPVFPTQAYVLTPADMDGQMQFERLQYSLQSHGITATRVSIVPDSKADYYRAMYSIFRNSSLEGVPMALVFEAHAVLHCRFRNRLSQLLASPRCGGHLHTYQQGGVLLLGAEQPTSAQLSRIDEDQSRAVSQQHDPTATLCYNTLSSTKGSFAALYHRGSFGEMLSWLHAHIRSKADPPSFQSVFSHLAEKGYIVRGALPNLAALPGSNLQLHEAVATSEIAAHLRWSIPTTCNSTSV